MINHKLLCLLEGKCWHEWEGGWSFPGEQHDYKCKKCGLIIPLAMLQDLHLPIPVSPDYSSPNTYLPFLQWFWKEKREMWEKFYWCGWDKYLEVYRMLEGYEAFQEDYVPWLYFLTLEGEPRIMTLLSEWLALPETKELWGWEKCESFLNCPFLHKGQEKYDRKNCLKNCNGTGRVKAEWAKEA